MTIACLLENTLRAAIAMTAERGPDTDMAPDRQSEFA